MHRSSAETCCRRDRRGCLRPGRRRELAGRRQARRQRTRSAWTPPSIRRHENACDAAPATTARSRTSRAKIRNASPRCAVSRNCDTRGSSTRPLFTMYQPSAPCAAPRAKMTARRTPWPGGIFLRARNHRNGTRNAKPITRPSSRWKYSHQKMRWNSGSVMPLFTCRYSGVCLVLRECGVPVGIGQRRQRAHDGLPLSDRQAGVREARDAADDDDREHERAADEEPRGDLAIRAPRAAVQRVGRERYGATRQRFHGANYLTLSGSDPRTPAHSDSCNFDAPFPSNGHGTSNGVPRMALAGCGFAPAASQRSFTIARRY